MARAGPADQVWPALASGLLQRHRPVVLRPCGDRTEPEFTLGSDCRWRNRNIPHDGSRILPDLVETARSRTPFADSNWRTRMTGGLVFIWPVMTAAFLASLVEAVEALTIVLAVATVRGWRPAGLGALAGLAVLALIVAALGPLLDHVPLHLLQFVIGVLLLLFGMRWLRKAILRAAGVIPLHDEDLAFATGTAALREQARHHNTLLDWLAGLASYKAMVLAGLEVVFVVIAVGAGRGLLAPASIGALAACALVAVVGFAVHRPLAGVPERSDGVGW